MGVGQDHTQLYQFHFLLKPFTLKLHVTFFKKTFLVDKKVLTN